MQMRRRPCCSHLAKAEAWAPLLSGLLPGTILYMMMLYTEQKLPVRLMRQSGMGDAEFVRLYWNCIRHARACYINTIIVARGQ